MKKLSLPNKHLLSAFLLLGAVSVFSASCRRDRYVCECYSKVKGATTYDMGEVKKSKADDQCNYIYIHLKSTDTSLYCQLTTPYKRN